MKHRKPVPPHTKPVDIVSKRLVWQVMEKLTRSTHEIPCSGVEHVWDQDAKHDTANIVEVSGEDDSLLSESGRWHLGDERVADWTDGEIVNTREDKDHRTACPGNSNVGVFGVSSVRSQ